MHHRSRRRNKSWLADVVALFFVLDGMGNELDHVFVAGALRHQASQIVLTHREKAGTDFAIRSDSDAAAMSAEGMRHRCDDPDLANAVVEDIAARGLAARVSDFAQLHELGHAAHNFVEGHDDLRRPHAVFFQRHEFDETDGDAFLAREAAKGGDLIVVEAAHQDTVDLHGAEPGTLRGADSGQHAFVAVGHARNAREFSGIDGVHRYRYPRQAG